MFDFCQNISWSLLLLASPSIEHFFQVCLALVVFDFGPNLHIQLSTIEQNFMNRHFATFHQLIFLTFWKFGKLCALFLAAFGSFWQLQVKKTANLRSKALHKNQLRIIKRPKIDTNWRNSSKMKALRWLPSIFSNSWKKFGTKIYYINWSQVLEAFWGRSISFMLKTKTFLWGAKKVQKRTHTQKRSNLLHKPWKWAGREVLEIKVSQWTKDWKFCTPWWMRKRRHYPDVGVSRIEANIWDFSSPR